MDTLAPLVTIGDVMDIGNTFTLLPIHLGPESYELCYVFRWLLTQSFWPVSRFRFQDPELMETIKQLRVEMVDLGDKQLKRHKEGMKWIVEILMASKRFHRCRFDDAYI